MRKRFLSLLFLLSYTFLLLSGCSDSKTPDCYPLPPNTPIWENVVLDRDLVEISERNGIVKIDSISAGLDTYSFETTLLDLAQNRQLCHVVFSEGAWISGLTENGFYAMNTLTKYLRIYDRSGSVTKELTFSDVSESMHFCALSENEKYFLYSDPAGTQATVIHLSDDRKSYIDIASPPRDVLSFEDDVLQLVSIGGEVFELDVTKASCTLVLADERIRRFSSDYCLGETESNFLVANADADRYVPISSADEIIVGMGENGFATATLSDNGHLLRFYDLKENTLSHSRSDEPVETICYTSAGSVLAVIGSSMERQHKLVALSLSAPEKLTVLTEDVAINNREETETPTGSPSSPDVLIENVPLISQLPAYPTGCEAVSTVMALRYAGYPISVEEFIDDYLPTSRHFYMENGKHFGPSPYEHFIGSPRSSASYGCMAPVIEKALCAYIEDDDRMKNVTNTSIADLCAQYVDNDIPVIMWVTMNMRETNPVNSWYLSDGTRFTWPGNEHCMLLVGYDDTQYYFNDPYTGKLVAYDKTLTQDRFAELGRQALVVLPQ